MVWAIFYGQSRNRFYAYDISAGAWTQYTSNVDLTEVVGLANANDTVYVLYRNASNQYFIAPLNTSDGSLGTGQRLSGFESDDAEDRTEGFTSFNDNLYISTGGSSPHLYQVNPNNGNLTTIGNISPTNSVMSHLATFGNHIYAYHGGAQGIYRADAIQGNRWEVLFPTSSTEVADDDVTLQLFTSPGAAVIELARQTDILGAIVFASDYDGASAHTISVGQNVSLALYKSNGKQLYEGSNEAVYATIPLQAPGIGE